MVDESPLLLLESYEVSTEDPESKLAPESNELEVSEELLLDESSAGADESSEPESTEPIADPKSAIPEPESESSSPSGAA